VVRTVAADQQQGALNADRIPARTGCSSTIKTPATRAQPIPRNELVRVMAVPGGWRWKRTMAWRERSNLGTLG
jgi:hypothetical protein